MDAVWYYPMPENPTFEEYVKWQATVGEKIRTADVNASIPLPLSKEKEDILRQDYEDYIRDLALVRPQWLISDSTLVKLQRGLK